MFMNGDVASAIKIDVCFFHWGNRNQVQHVRFGRRSIFLCKQSGWFESKLKSEKIIMNLGIAQNIRCCCSSSSKEKSGRAKNKSNKFGGKETKGTLTLQNLVLLGTHLQIVALVLRCSVVHAIAIDSPRFVTMLCFALLWPISSTAALTVGVEIVALLHERTSNVHMCRWTRTLLIYKSWAEWTSERVSEQRK